MGGCLHRFDTLLIWVRSYLFFLDPGDVSLLKGQVSSVGPHVVPTPCFTPSYLSGLLGAGWSQPRAPFPYENTQLIVLPTSKTGRECRALLCKVLHPFGWRVNAYTDARMRTRTGVPQTTLLSVQAHPTPPPSLKLALPLAILISRAVRIRAMRVELKCTVLSSATGRSIRRSLYRKPQVRAVILGPYRHLASKCPQPRETQEEL